MAAQSRTVKTMTGGGVLLALALTLAWFLLFRAGAGAGVAANINPATIPASQTITIDMHGQHFQLDKDTVKAGQPVAVVLTNHDTMTHEFSINGLDVDSKIIRPGETVTLTFVVDQAGDYRFICPMPGHVTLGMFGTLHVVP